MTARLACQLRKGDVIRLTNGTTATVALDAEINPTYPNDPITIMFEGTGYAALAPDTMVPLVDRMDVAPVTPLDVACVACNAKAGSPCTTPTDTSRKNVRWYHHAREDDASAVNS